MNKKISFASLVILMIAAIDNIRNLPAAAMFGSSLIFFFVFSALVFLIPTSLVAAELSAAFPDSGGIYQWVNRAFGKRMGMAAIWLQWINTMVWYPTMLSFIAGTLAYLIDPELAQNKTYLVTCILTTFWGLTYVNLKGLNVSAIINNICCIVGTMLPLGLLICMGFIWFFSGQPIQIDFTVSKMIPSLGETTSWISLIAIMASFLGMELSGVHVNDIENSKKNYPRAALVACLFIFLSMLFGSLAIAFVMPANEINLISGVMQMFGSFFKAFHMEALTPVLGVLIVVGSVGMMINWLISPAKGLLHAAEYGFLPPFFAKKNAHGVASNILLAQGIFVTLMCLLFLLEPNVNAFYWFLTALSTELYMIMYLLMFAAAIKLHYSFKARNDAYQIPGKALGIWTICLLGIFGASTTIFVSFIPPENINTGGSLQYLYMICGGNILALSPLALFYYYQSRKKRAIAN